MSAQGNLEWRPAAFQIPGMMPTYTIAPEAGGGFVVTGPLITRRQWYADDSHAACYAHWLLRDTGGRIEVRDSTGYCIITEHVAPEVAAYLYDGAPVRFADR